jgi:hypothetical protein
MVFSGFDSFSRGLHGHLPSIAVMARAMSVPTRAGKVLRLAMGKVAVLKSKTKSSFLGRI